ncbi:TetR family transcriptional regulator [Oleiagrimonas sp. C23AA]|uniref:TetR/AcrR family transcriptional regulator n=1 Tax=Oleiagrimonas sp. C23AA TaxID=2719047 RepID=UPI00141DEEF2|nr:TetR family transcriptional regulator [Oleiagrimonas sp. C23AA]NII11461.1 TetR/AcrR family transcriptional regulator [Oleiagrimonas sp. C23AA]
MSNTPTTQARGRRAGRPAGDDADLRNQLLDTAASLFARNGIAGTSLRAIADAAEVTPAMLHYYFGGKAALVDALIDERLKPAVQPLHTRLASTETTPPALIEAFVRGMAEVIGSHAWLPALWVREVVCEGGALRPAVFERVVPQLPQIMAEHFRRAQNAGQLAPGIDPQLLVVSLVGLTMFPAAGEPIWRQVFDTGAMSVDGLVRHVLSLLGQGIRGVSGDER